MDSLKNIEAEMSVIGACLLDHEEVLPKVTCLIPEDFSDQRHRLIWPAVLSLYQRNEVPDLVTLSAELKRQGKLEEADGSSYLATLLDYVPTAANVAYYVKLVKECSGRRSIADVGRKITTEAIESESAGEALDRADSMLLSLRQASSDATAPSGITDLLRPTFDQLETLYHSGESIQGVSTGIPQLDRLTCGLQAGDLIIVAGRPSMGKTALGLNMAQFAAKQRNRTLIFSLEMSKEQLTHRLLSSSASVDANRFRNGRFKDADWEKLTIAAGHINGTPLVIDDRASITVMNIRFTARQELRKGGLGLIVIDYLQLIRPVKAQQVREREVADISRSLKALAKELKVPVIVLAQLNRGSESGVKPRPPVPSDLRESGSLEQDADLILFPWRESVYCDRCKSAKRDCGKGHYRKAEIIIGKQRNGPTGKVKVAWLGEFTRFEPLDDR